MQPPEIDLSAVFAQEEAQLVSGRSTLRTAALDAILASIHDAFEVVRSSLYSIQRDDAEIRDGMVKLHTLSADVLLLIASTVFNVRGPWLTGTPYSKGDVTSSAGTAYLCFIAHTSGVLATDVAAGNWAAIGAPTSVNIAFSPTATLSSTNVQAAIEELDAAFRPFVNVLKHHTYGGF